MIDNVDWNMIKDAFERYRKVTGDTRDIIPSDNMQYGNGAKTRHSNIDYHSEKMNDARRKNAAKTRKAVLQFTKDGQFIARYNSGKDASRATGANHSHILECCNGKRYKTVNGFVWKFEIKKGC